MEPSENPEGVTLTQRWALVVRVIAARNVPASDSSSRRSKLALRVAVGESVKRTLFEEVNSGRVRWNEELVFIVDPSADNVVELSTVRSASSASSSFRGTRPPPSTYISGRGFAEVGSEQHAGWFPMQSKEDVKLSLFWRVVPDDSIELEGLKEDSNQRKAAASPSFRKMFFSAGGSSRSSNALAESDASGTRKILCPHDVIYALDSEMSSVISRRARLTFSLLAGRGLRPVNLGGKSDPFAIVSIRGSRRKTRVEKNTLDPVWTRDNSFTFGEIEDLDEEDELHIVVKDWDPLGRYKDLGQVVVTLRKVQAMTERDGPITSQWFELAPTIYMPGKYRQGDLGSIQISVSFTPKQRLEVATSPSSHPGISSPPSSPSPPVRTPLSPVPRSPALQTANEGVAGPTVLSPSSAPLTTSERPKLYVRLIQARNLFASDFGGVSDPYVVLTCKNETKRTTTSFKTLTPSYDFETIFGDKEYIQENDELVIRIFDQDSTISSIVDDELGSLRIPMWSLLLDDSISMEAAMAQPRWYSLEPFNSKQKCAGEVQLALYYSNPSSKKKDIYKGKVWLFELQSTILTARNLGSMSADPHARIKPYCTISCGGRRDRWKTNVASNGVNPTWSERFRFRQSADSNSEREGILKTDVLRISVFNAVTSECLGKLSVDVAFIMDKLGYIDLQGKAFTSWFDLAPGTPDDDATAEDGQDLVDDDENGLENGLDDGDASTDIPDSSSQGGIQAVRHHAMKFSSVIKRRLTGPASLKRNGSTASASSAPSTPALTSEMRLDTPPPSARSISDLETTLVLDEKSTLVDERTQSSKRSPKGQIRLTLRLVPIGETRMKNKKKLVVYVDEANAASKATEKLPSLIYLKCRVGFDAKTSAPVPLCANVETPQSRIHALLEFEEEIDWLMDAAAKRKAAEEKQLRRYRHSTGGDIERAKALLRQNAGSVQDVVLFSIHDADDDHVICEAKTTFLDVLLGKKLFEPSSLTLPLEGKLPLSLGVSMKIVDVKEEMIPLLGHIYARLVSFKSTLSPRFDQSLRFVVRYGERVVASKAVVGDPFPDLLALFGNDPFRFPIYNAFKALSIEIWQTRASSMGGGDGGEGNQAIALAKSVLSVFKRSDSTGSGPGTDGTTGTSEIAIGKGSKYGTLFGTASLTLFDLVELEAQTVFEEDGMTRNALEKAFKIRVRDKSGREVGSLWMEGRYAENVGGVLSPNPNPPTQPGKPFSLANFRHEVNRLVKVLGWLTAFNSHVGALLNWESPTKTVSTIVTICVVCSVDWFSSRWLMVFPFCLLIHMINRHRLRSNGMLLSEFEDTEEGEEGLSAEVRVACLFARQGDHKVSKPWRKVHAQVSLLARPSKPPKVIGLTRVDPRPENGEVDFCSSKAGYSVRTSAKSRPSVQMWKYSESLSPVPCFNFRVENFTVLKDTILSVTLFCARNLIVADANGFSDPFAKIFIKDAVTGQMAGDVIRSSVRFKTLNPVWNERFILGEKKAVVASNILVLHFFDSDVIATSNDPLGNLEIDLSQLPTLFPPTSGNTQLTQEERAIREKRWFPLAPPKGFKKKDSQKSPDPFSFGEVCLHVEWMDFHSRISTEDGGSSNKARALANKADVNHSESASEDGAEDSADEIEKEDELPLDTWTRCGAQIAVDLFDQRESFLGRALVPLGSVVSNDESRIQPQVDMELPLFRKFDGSKDDAKLTEDTLVGEDPNAVRGYAKVRMMVTLPDPKAKERRMAIMEAKRADRSNAFQKMRMITKHLERAQAQLAAVNSRAERMKNLFNWTHPRRTELMFNLMLFLFVLFILIPSRFFILMIVLFFFTEKFRPMGTMGARFKHLLSQLPTDDDLRTVVQGDAASGKRKVLSVPVAALPAASPSTKRQALRRSGSQSERSARQLLRSTSSDVTARRSVAPEETRSPHVNKKELVVKLQNICASDALFSGHLSFAKLPKQSEDYKSGTRLSGKSLDFSRCFVIVSNIGMHYWTDRDAMDSSKALGHMVPITDVVTTELPEITGFTRSECLFIVESDRDRIICIASSESKKHSWINAIRAHALKA